MPTDGKTHAALSVGEYRMMTFAPCGARIVGRGTASEIQSSTESLARVTCEDCRALLGRAAKAYNRARRLKEIDW